MKLAIGEWRIVPARPPQVCDAVLFARLPSASNQYVSLRMFRDGGHGGRDGMGHWWSWDGDMDKPSLRGSIQGDDWHGWLDKGELVERVYDEPGVDWRKRA